MYCLLFGCEEETIELQETYKILSPTTDTRCKGSECIATITPTPRFALDDDGIYKNITDLINTYTIGERTIVFIYTDGYKAVRYEFWNDTDEIEMDDVKIVLPDFSVKDKLIDKKSLWKFAYNLTGTSLTTSSINNNGIKLRLYEYGNSEQLLIDYSDLEKDFDLKYDKSGEFIEVSNFKSLYLDPTTTINASANETGDAMAYHGDDSASKPCGENEGTHFTSAEYSEISGNDGTCWDLYDGGLSDDYPFFRVVYKLPYYESINWINITQNVQWDTEDYGEIYVWNFTEGNWTLETSELYEGDRECPNADWRATTNITETDDYINATRHFHMVLYQTTSSYSDLFLDYAQIEVSYQVVVQLDTPQFNETSIDLNEPVFFSVNVTHQDGNDLIDKVIATFRYPDTSTSNQTLVRHLHNSSGEIENDEESGTQTETAIDKEVGLGMSVYRGGGDASIPEYRTYQNNTFNAEATANDVTGTQTFVEAKANPVKDEVMICSSDSSDDLNCQAYNGSTGTWSNVAELSTDAAGGSIYHGFDICYESVSGDAIVFYRDSDVEGSDVYYDIWSNGAWISTDNEMYDTGVYTIEFIRCKSDKDSDYIAVMSVGTDDDVWYGVWDGGSVAVSGEVDSDGSNCEECYSMDMAWENVGTPTDVNGELILAYYADGDHTIDGGRWDATSGYTAVNDVFSIATSTQQTWIDCESNPDPSEDEIICCVADDGNDLTCNDWQGSSWGTPVEVDGSTQTVTNVRHPLELAYENVTYNAVLVYSDGTVPEEKYSVWGANDSWTTVQALPTTNAPGNTPNYWSIDSDFISSEGLIMAGMWDASDDGRVILWNGTTQTWNTSWTLMETEGGTYDNMRFVFPKYSLDSQVDGNGTTVTYNDIDDTDVTNILNVTIIVDVTTYTNTGSSNAGNSMPDLFLEVNNGTWKTIGNLSVSGTGNVSSDLTSYTDVLAAWATNDNRDFRLIPRYMDYSSGADVIAWNGVYVYIEYNLSENTTSWETEWTDTSSSGTYNVTDIYANDTNGNINHTSYENVGFVVLGADTCTYSSGDWDVDCSDDCSITSAVDLGGNNIEISGTGTFKTTASIYNYGTLTIKGTDSNNKCIVTCAGGCFEGYI